MSDLRKKTINGLIWTFAQQFGVQIINFAVSIVLARLLLPAEFGLLGMIAIFMAIGNSLVDSGMTSSLIRSDQPDNVDYSTVFFTNLGISVLVYGISFLAAPAIALYFEQPILSALVRVYCLTFIIRAFSAVQSTKLNKEMNFRTQMMINVPSLIVGGIFGIYLAYNGFGVWSLVYMNLFQTMISTIQLWLFSKWSPQFIFDRERLKTHLGFGYKLTLSGILDSTIKNLYTVIIGKYFSAAQLGFFIRAKSMQELPVTNLSNALNKVMYPMFASISNDDVRLKSVYQRLVKLIFFIVAPILILAMIIAEPLFRFLLTEKWLPAVPYFQILCLAGIFAPLNSYNLNVLLVKGKSAKFLKLGVIRNVLTIISVGLALVAGIDALLWSIVAISAIVFVINATACGKILGYSFFQQLRDISGILIIAFVCGAIGYHAAPIIKNYINHDLLVIVFVSLLYGAVYLCFCAIFKIEGLLQVKQIILKNRKG